MFLSDVNMSCDLRRGITAGILQFIFQITSICFRFKPLFHRNEIEKIDVMS